MMQAINTASAVNVRTVPPHDSGYLLLAAEIDWRGPFRRDGRSKRRVLALARGWCAQLATRPDVIDATAFRAVLIAPGEGAELVKAWTGGDYRARYDVVVLIRTRSVEAARRLQKDYVYAALASTVRLASRDTLEVIAENASPGDVDHRPDHVFLFNYFYADDEADLIPVFEYTADWLQARTGPPNSVLLRPLGGEPGRRGIINHASWPSFRSFLPGLFFRPTFRSFVLANFAANNVAAQPILYRRV